MVKSKSIARGRSRAVRGAGGTSLALTALATMGAGAAFAATAARGAAAAHCRTQRSVHVTDGPATLDVTLAWTCRSVAVLSGNLVNTSATPASAYVDIAGVGARRIASATDIAARTTRGASAGTVTLVPGKSKKITSSWNQVNVPGGAGTIVAAIVYDTNPTPAIVATTVHRPPAPKPAVTHVGQA